MLLNRERFRGRCWHLRAAASLAWLAGCAASAESAPEAPAPPESVGTPLAPAGTVPPQAIVDASDRTPEDREVDERRHPVELLEFLGVTPGSRVADLAAGSGDTTELLARAVGPSGVVYAQNDKATIDQYLSESWPKRLARDATRNVVRMDREFDAPFAPEAHHLGLVTLSFSYHDIVAGGADRSKRDPNDDATEPSLERGFATDRFILEFKKPEAS